MKTFLVIPLYNEDKQIADLLKSLKKFSLRTVVVDDGSTDDSLKIIENFRNRSDGKIDLLKHLVNIGKGSAMKTGSDYAFANGADAVIFMDSDAQHSPDDLTKFIKLLDTKRYDVILGVRDLEKGMPFIRLIGNKIASLTCKMLFKVATKDALCGYRAITKNVYKKLMWDSQGYGVEIELLARIGKNNISFTEVSVETIYHDKNKGVTVLNAIGILEEALRWKWNIR